MPRPRVNIYLTEEAYQILQGLAEHETRTVSNMAEHLVMQGLRDRGLLSTPSLSQLQSDDSDDKK